MPEINVRNNNINRTADDNLIMLAKNIARAYHEIGVLTEREYNRTRRTNDLNIINDVIGDIPNMEMGQRLKFCKSFVANDTENFNNATPAILAYAYMATRGEDTPMARALATRIDDMSADFANSGGMVLENGTDWPLVDLSNIADVYEGFTNALNARIADLDAARDATKISEMKSNLAQMETVISEYDNAWGLNRVHAENAQQYERRWNELNDALNRAKLSDETKEQVKKYNFTDENKETIPQFLENGELDSDSRVAALLDLARGDIARRRVTDIDSDIDADKIGEELNDEFLIKLYETANADKIVQMSQENPETFMDTQKRNEFIRGLATQGGEISDIAYNAALDENANATAGWTSRFKKKLGTSADKVSGLFDKVFHRNEKVDRLSGARMAPQPIDMRQKRIELFKRILKGFASGFVASAIITTIATAAAATAGISLAASMAAIGIITAIGMGIIQVRRWQKNHPDGKLKDMLKDTRLLTSLEVSAVAVIAMCFGAAGMAEAAMALGYGALALGGTKNAVEAYRDARNFRSADGKRMSVAESIAWAIANAGAVVAGGLTGRMAANAAINAYNNANSENRLFQNETTRTERQEFTKEVEHSKTVTDYTDEMLEGAKSRVESWYRDNPDLLQQRIDAIEQYNIEHGTDIDPYRALNVIGLAGEQTPDNMMLHVNNGGAVSSHGQHGVYTGAKWQNTYGYTPEQIDLVAHTFNPDGTINSDAIDIVRNLDLHHLGTRGTVGVVDGLRGAHTDGVLPQNDVARGTETSFNGRVHSVYAPLGETPTQHTETWTETQTDYRNVPVPDYNRVDVNNNMAAFGNYNPRDNRRTALRDRIGTFWNRVRDSRHDESKPVETIEPVKEEPIIEPILEDKPTDEVIVEDTPKTPAPEKIDVNFEDVFTPSVDIDEVEHRPADKEKNPFDLPIVTPVVEQEPVDDKILALTRPQAKAWHDLNARLDKVRKKLDKSPHGSKAAKLRAEESKLKYYIANLCNKIGHNDYEAIERAAREALLREDLNHKAELINAWPGENATKWEVADWRSEIAKLNKNIDKKIEKFNVDTIANARAEESRLYFPAPVPGVQRQKKDARGYVKLPSENELYPHAEDIVIEEPVVMTEPENTPHKTTKAERRAARWAEKQKRKDAHRKFIASLPQKIERFKLFDVLRRAEQKKRENVLPNREYNIPESLEKLTANVTLVDKPITSIRGVPVYLVDIGNNKNPVTQNRERPMVVVQVGETPDDPKNSELIRIPFYLATGLEEYSQRPTGHWYPLSVLTSDGRMLAGQDYNIPELTHIAAALDAELGDIRNYRDVLLSEKRAAHGYEGWVGGSDVMQHLDPMIVKNTFDESVYDNQGLYSSDIDHATLADYQMENALSHVKSSTWVERKRGIGAGIRNIGRRALNRFGFGHDDYEDENER